RAQPEEASVNGRVLDASGRPVAGADVSSFWTAGEADNTPVGTMRSSRSAATGRDGKFSLKDTFFNRGKAFLALDAARQTGGLVVVDPRDADKPVTIRLAPLVSVQGKFTCRGLGDEKFWTNVYISTLPGKERFLSCSSRAAEFAFKLPPGKYEFH